MNVDLNWINRSLLPKETRSDHKDGYYAEFYGNGQLRHFGFYRGGEPDNWTLNLEEGKEEGEARLEAGSGGTPDYELYRNGTYEAFNAWSDNSPARPKLFKVWVEEWILRITSS